MRFGADEEKLEKIRESVLQITKGWDHLEVKKLVAETINEVIEPLIFEEALELIDHHMAQGDEVWLVSASPAEIVEPFAELLGVTGAISSRAKIDELGKFTGEMEFFARARIRRSPFANWPRNATSISMNPSRTPTPRLTSPCSNRSATPTPSTPIVNSPRRPTKVNGRY